MNAFTLDTPRAATRLREAFGFDERHAAGVVAALAEGMSAGLDALATKAGIAGPRGEVALLRGKMTALETRMTIRLGAPIAAAAGFLVVVDKLL